MDNESESVVTPQCLDTSTDAEECDEESVQPDIKSFHYDQTPAVTQSESEPSSAAPVSTLSFKQHVGRVHLDSSTAPGAVPVYPSNVDPDHHSSHEFSVHDTRDSSNDIENDIVQQEIMVPIAAQVVGDDKEAAEAFDARVRAEVERVEERVRRQILAQAANADIVTSSTQIVNNEPSKGYCVLMKKPKVIVLLGIVVLLVLISIIVSVVVTTSRKGTALSSMTTSTSYPTAPSAASTSAPSAAYHSTASPTTVAPSSSLTPTITSHPTKPIPVCWDNTTEIYLHLERQKPFARNVYILCPHTLFYIGYSASGQCCLNGELPLFGRDNTHYLCGEDGKSSNDCTLYGGTTQVSIDEILFPGAATDVLFQGITFQAADDYILLPSAPGDFTFLDCIFKNHRNRGLFILFHFPAPVGGRRRRLLDKKESLRDMDLLTKLDYLTSKEYLQEVREITEQYKTGEHINDYLDVDNNGDSVFGVFDDRDLQDTGVEKFTKMTGNWINCTFQNNEQGPTEGFITFGLLTSIEPRNFMNFDGCLFQDNNYGNSDVVITGFAIKSDGSAVGINNSFFIDNNFIGTGPVQALNGTQVAFKNVYGTHDEGVTCEFIAFSPSVPTDPNDITCMDFDVSSCMLTLLADLSAPATGAPSSSGGVSVPTAPSAGTVPTVI